MYHRAIVLLIAATIVVSACGGAGAAPSVSAGPSVAATVSSAPAVASGSPTTSATLVPSPSISQGPVPSLAPLAVLWKSKGTTSARISFQPIAVDPTTSDIWVAVPFDNLFWIFRADGTYIGSWGTAGKGPGQLDLNDHLQNADGFGAIAFAPNGTFYVGDIGNYRVQMFDAKRAFVKEWGSFGHHNGQFAQITDIATDGKIVAVGDGDRGDIQVFAADGTYQRTLEPGFAAFVAIDRAGDIYATNPSTGAPAVAKYDASGKQTARFDMSWAGDAVGLAVDRAGHIFVGIADVNPPYYGKATYELAPDGHVLRGWAHSGGGFLALSTNADTVYIAGEDWPNVIAYMIPKS